MISIVCVYNNEKVLNNCLLRSLENQTAKFELYQLDNTQGRFKSAAEALNYGGKRAKGDYIMFVHQDVDLCSDSWLEEAQNTLGGLPKLGIAGVAGKSKDKLKGVITNIKHGIPPRLAGETQIESHVKVQTLDECIVIIPRRVFDILQFDEKTSDDWHLYAVDYCLSVKRLGFNVYVIPMYVYHMSDGCLRPRASVLLNYMHESTHHQKEANDLAFQVLSSRRAATATSNITTMHSNT